jgi:hypothetical protein
MAVVTLQSSNRLRFEEGPWYQSSSVWWDPEITALLRKASGKAAAHTCRKRLAATAHTMAIVSLLSPNRLRFEETP